MTEDEAKTKWCPFVRSTVVGQQADGKLTCLSNRDSAQMVEVGDVKVMTHNCIGSACMAWRWNVSPADAERHNAANTYRHRETEDGHCGLAGKS